MRIRQFAGRWRRGSRLLGLAVASAGALAISACGGSSDTATTADGGSKAPAGSDTLVWAKSFDVESLDPARLQEVTGSIVTSVLYDRLMTFEGDSPTPTPMLAESYEASDDQKTFTFTLRDDATFADGSPVTADDVVFSFNRLRNIQAGPSYLAAGIKRVSAPDRLTVVIEMLEPTPGLPALVASSNFSVLNSRLVKANGGDDSKQAVKRDTAQRFLDSQSAGSGMYTLAGYDRRSRITLEANPDYWGKPAGFERIILKNVPSENQLLEVEKGTAQLAVDLSPNQVRSLRSDAVKITTGPSVTFFFLTANTDPKISEVAANPDIQEAIRYGVDYENLLQLVGEGAVQPPSILPSVIAGHLPAGEAVKRDVERAKAAVERSGIANPKIELEYPSDFTLNGLSFGTIAQRVQAQLREVGIELELKPGPLSTTLDNWRGGREQLGLWTQTPSSPSPYDFLTFCPGGDHSVRVNWQRGADQELEDLCARAAQTAFDDTDALDEAFGAVQRRLNEVGPFFPLFQPAQVVASADWVTNIRFSNSYFVDLAQIGRE